MTSHINPRAHDAWLVDLDGTLYAAPWVKLMMAAELGFGGWSSVRILRRFRHEHERLRSEQDAEPQAEDVTPFLLQIERTAHALKVDRDTVEQAVSVWMIERPKKWIT